MVNKWLLGLWASFTAAQTFVPTPPAGKTVNSSVLEGAGISFKQTSVCETTEGLKPYSGYVTIPSRHLEDASAWKESQSAHLFFWYFPAREETSSAPTAMYLAGGPGASGLDAMSSFPCYINPDSNSTTLNPHSWNKRVNMLYIDQPVGTGFSYVELANGLLDTLTANFTVMDAQDLPELSVTKRQATLNRASANDTSDEETMATVPLTSKSAARTLWKFAQVWFQEFPERNTDNEEISIWGSSWGGFYAPATVSYFLQQNELIANETHDLSTAKELDVVTLGLLEPAVDTRFMSKAFPEFSINNTYGIEVYSQEVYEMTKETLEAPKEGCLDLIDECRRLAAKSDPQGFGTNEKVNYACSNALDICFNKVAGAMGDSNRNPFDITQAVITAWPPYYQTAFFNQRWVQEDLGVPLNWTATSNIISDAFLGKTGEAMTHDLSAIEQSLEAGLNVAMMIGDRDGRCPWIGVEAASLALDFEAADAFRSAGYEKIYTNSSYEGGFVRETPRLSFSRIFQAGHGLGGYQPETMSKVFDRAVFRRDIASGEVDLTGQPDYASQGPESVRHETNDVPEANVNVCYVLNVNRTCTPEQQAALDEGSAVVKDWVVVEPKGINGGFSPSDGNGNGNGNGNGAGNGNGSDNGSNSGCEGDGANEAECQPSEAQRKRVLLSGLAIAVVASLIAL